MSEATALTDTELQRELIGVLTAYRNGNFKTRMPTELTGVHGKVADLINEVIDQSEHMSEEFNRIGQAVGRRGRLDARIEMPELRGSWRRIVSNGNQLLDDMVNPMNEIVRVIRAVARGDLTQSVSTEVAGSRLQGQHLQSAKILNTMVEQLRAFSGEVTRVAREVGTDGTLGGQAAVPGASGTWKDLTDNVNGMATSLTNQVRNIAEVTTAVANGDLSKKITVDARGEVLALKETINTMVEQLSAFAEEVTRVAREVGTEGVLGGQAAVPGVSGTWKDLTDNVNGMATNLTNQVRNIAEVTTAVAKGDLSQKITVNAEGEVATLKETINTMVDQLDSFAEEVTRVAREVGTDGVLGGQAKVKGVSGTWKDLTENVNNMASSLTAQVRNIAEVTTAVAKGDLSKTITVDAQGEVLALKETINTMVEQLSSFAEEVTRVAREVGTDGVLGGQARVRGVSGTWKDLTDNVNGMATNLTNQVRNIAEVTTAVAKGDLSQKITVNAEGEVATLKETINTMVDQLSSFAEEVTRVAREVGTDGVLGGQAKVKGVSGTWKDLTDNVNGMATNLTNQVRNIAEVTTAVADGDLSKKIEVDAQGEVATLKETINTMVDQLSSFAEEVTRVAREVGTEGVLGGQAAVPGASGTWKDLTDNVNGMATNLTNQVRNIAEVTTAVAKGDLSKKIEVDVRGEVLALKETINSMVDQLDSFAGEVTRVAREVGTEGILGGQANVPGVSGTWKDLTDNVNGMATNLTNQVRNIAEVTTAVADGDLSKKIEVDAQGEVATLKETINTMVDQLSSFAEEVTRVAREVGTEGVLGGQAAVPGVSGTWKDLTDNVNGMATNLTDQVRNIAEVTTAVAKGDLSKKITVDVRGEVATLKDTINDMVDQLSAFGEEVTRVAREVGTEGILGGQAKVKGVSGTWKYLTDNVNLMANNLTNQVRNIAEVTTAVAEGDLSRKITVDAAGEVATLKETINTMVDQLSSFAEEVTRVAREVGTEGVLGGQAKVKGVSGTWKDLTDNVNGMATALTAQVRNIADVTTAVANGNLSKKITVDARGEVLALKETINTMVDQLGAFANEVTRVAREVGTDGTLGGQANVPGASGTWKDLTDNVNGMASNLTSQVRNIAEVTTAVAKGDLSKKITVDVRGEVASLKNTINVMVDQLSAFAEEVTRVAREVGTDGVLGGQATVKGVSGTWKDLTDNVNVMATNLTNQVRGISRVVLAVAEGDLSKRFTVDAKGEVAELADTINNMTDTLSIFADQVTLVAQDVGVEGKLGGQAKVPGVSGTWKNLTDNVNELAANLTNQVRAIAEVAEAVTSGDYSRNVQVEARGEVDDLKRSVNQMINTLRVTTRQNQEQDWLKTNLAKVTRVLQDQPDQVSLARRLLSELADLIDIHAGVYYIAVEHNDAPISLNYLYGYAYRERKHLANSWNLGEGLVGQCAYEKQRILLTGVPGDYIEITSGLGSGTPQNVLVVPLMFEEKVLGVLEVASFNQFKPIDQSFVDQLSESVGMILNTLDSNVRTKGLLSQSQKLAAELQSQQEELRHSNEELEEKALLLEQQKTEVESKNELIEATRRTLEERARQLALTSKYKSEFLSSMSHELRTPLNSLLILSKKLADNRDGNMNPRQVEFADTIHTAGTDLLELINEILDLSKIESGTVVLSAQSLPFKVVQEVIEKQFMPVAEKQRLLFDVEIDRRLPDTIFTDRQRLFQVLKNLLANAFKFTEKGSVSLGIRPVSAGWSPEHAFLNQADRVIAFEVIDTGIGMDEKSREMIFEAFQQADTGTAKRYGGTGLGLSISREIALLLGGELVLAESQPGRGSTFVFYLPDQVPDHEQPRRRETLEQPPSDPTPVEGRAPASASRTDHSTPMPRGASASQAVDGLPHDATEDAVVDDRDSYSAELPTLLIVEDDQTFARIVLEEARQLGMQVLVAATGKEGLELFEEYHPDMLSIDVLLPDISGLEVAEVVRREFATHHMPIMAVSSDDDILRYRRVGVHPVLIKPTPTEEIRKGLKRLRRMSAEPDRRILCAGDASAMHGMGCDEFITTGDEMVNCPTLESLEALDATPFDLAVLGVNEENFEDSAPLLDALVHDETKNAGLPVLLMGDAAVVRRLPAIDRLQQQAQIAFFEEKHELFFMLSSMLARPMERLPEPTRQGLQKLISERNSIEGHRVLVVDDDMRNIFALTALLEDHGIEIAHATSGRAAIELLENEQGIDLVFMDIMMPEMDGYEAIGHIRELEHCKTLPIVALTAKAMPGDREACISAGATDYISKPIVDAEQILAAVRRSVLRY